MQKILRKLRNRNAKKTASINNLTESIFSSLSSRLETNLADINLLLGKSSDTVIREFKIGREFSIGAALVYIDGLVAKEIINESTMKSLMLHTSPGVPTGKNIIETIKQYFLTVGGVHEARIMEQIVDHILSGDTVLFIDGSEIALIISSRGWEARGVTEPTTESVVRGPREGFTETLQTNTAMIRRKIKDPRLIIETLKLGRTTKTDIALAYIAGVAKDDLVAEVKKRLEQIKVDSILESGNVEELIEDAPFSLFPTIANTQKPDVVAGKLLEGRVAVIVDGTPHVLTMPAVFMEYLQSSEDYYSNFPYVIVIRWLRIIALMTAAFLPSFYVAVTAYHAVMIPTPMLITIASARAGVPFPATVEAFLMGLIFEGLREAGVRMPRPVGPAVSIVGALVIGDAAIAAGITSAGMVIIVSITAIASFIVPYPEVANALVPIRLLMLISAGIFGLYGLMLTMLILAAHLVTLESFGVPYLYPLAPLSLPGLKDTLLRVPQWATENRPLFLENEATAWQNQGKEDRRD